MMPYLTEAEFDKLIPVGEWAYTHHDSTEFRQELRSKLFGGAA
jgi:hypothetical protein